MKLQFFLCECTTDKRKDFPQNTIKALFDYSTELREIKFLWENVIQTENPVFIKSELEEILGNSEKFKIEIGEADDWIKITREI